MEFKVIIYIVIGVLYFLYSMGKKVEEKKKASSSTDNAPPVSKPVSPPVANPLEDIMRELKRKQSETEAQKKVATSQPKPLTTYQQKKPQKEILVRETKKATFAEGSTDYEPVYERELTVEEKIERGNIRLKNEGIYKIQTIEEAQTESDTNRDFTFDLDARQAFIGSVIFERKY